MTGLIGRPISLPAEYMSTKRVIEPERKEKFQPRQDVVETSTKRVIEPEQKAKFQSRQDDIEGAKSLERVQLTPRLDMQSPQTLQKRTPMTGLDRYATIMCKHQIFD
jgi:hypothetical protein